MPQANSQTITPQDQLAMAGQLRQEKSGGKEKAEPEEKSVDQQPRTLREQVMAARRAMDIKQRAKDKIEEKIVAPAKAGTKQGLKWAWGISASVIGFLPGILYINTHAFLRLIFPKFFCELGEEWYPEQLQKIMDKAGVKSAVALKVGEKMLLVFLDVLLIIAFFILFSVLAWVYENSVLSWALEKILL